MERLTERTTDPIMLCPLIKALTDDNEYCKSQNCDCDNCKLGKKLSKLASYEDAEEHGKLIGLPCKVGDTVYRVLDAVYPYKVTCIYIYNDAVYITMNCEEKEWGLAMNAIGFEKKLFLTKEEAEQALARMEG